MNNPGVKNPGVKTLGWVNKPGVNNSGSDLYYVMGVKNPRKSWYGVE